MARREDGLVHVGVLAPCARRALDRGAGQREALADSHAVQVGVPLRGRGAPLTENGADYHDRVGSAGTVEDGERIVFIREHLLAGHAALRQGANLKGWFVWTLLDNFEWAEGYSRRFGLVQVDRQTMTRTPKASYHWYADAIRRNGVNAA